jgi:pimeloyl-ACP methyl ester carboxylesterase
VSRPRNVDDLLLDMDVANERRNSESMASLVRCVASVRRFGLRRELMLHERWRSLTMPTLFLWGEQDAFAPPEDVEVVVAEQPNLHLVRLPEAGHLPWIDEPETVVDEIGRFLATDERAADRELFMVHRSSA